MLSAVMHQKLERLVKHLNRLALKVVKILHIQYVGETDRTQSRFCDTGDMSQTIISIKPHWIFRIMVIGTKIVKRYKDIKQRKYEKLS